MTAQTPAQSQTPREFNQVESILAAAEIPAASTWLFIETLRKLLPERLVEIGRVLALTPPKSD